MSAVDLRFKAIDVSYYLNEQLSTFPIQWNSKDQTFSFTKSHKKRLWWYLWCLVLIPGMGVGLTSVSFMRQIYYPKDDITMLHLVMWGVIILMAGFVYAAAWAVIFFGEATVNVYNQLAILGQKLNKKEKETRDEEPPSRAHLHDRNAKIASHVPWIFKENGQLDIVGLALIYAMVFIRFLSSVPALFLFALRLDPLTGLLIECLPQSVGETFVVQAIVWILCIFLTLVAYGEAGRMLSFIPIFLFIPNTIYLDAIENMQILSTRIRTATATIQNETKTLAQIPFETLYTYYEQLRIVNITAMQFASPEGFFIAGFCFIMAVFVNYCTIKLYSYEGIPWYLYSMFPLSCLLILLSINTILPFAINMHENSGELLHSWRGRTDIGKGAKNKYWRKKFKALQTIRLYIGINGFNLCLIEHDLKIAFPYVVTDHTITLLFSF